MKRAHLAVAVDDTDAMQPAALQAVTDEEPVRRVRQRNGVPRTGDFLLELDRSQARLSVTGEHLDEPRATTGNVNIAT